MQYWKLFNKSWDPDKPDLIFRFYSPGTDEPYCLEQWDGTEWVDASGGSLHLEDYLGGEAGARAISEADAKAFIDAM